MKRAVNSGLPKPSAPIEWATIADGVVYTAQIPLRPDGSIESGDIKTQTRLTLDNLRKTVLAAGGTLSDVSQVLVYLPDPKDFTGMNEVYGQYFAEPFPNRATIVAQLMVPGARIEIVAYAHVGRSRSTVQRASSKKVTMPARKTTAKRANNKSTPKRA